jgi:hypothetical protein
MLQGPHDSWQMGEVSSLLSTGLFVPKVLIRIAGF